MSKVKSVVAEVEGPSKKDMIRAMGYMLCLNFNRAQHILRGELTVRTIDSAGKPMYGMSGGSKIEVYVNHDKEPAAPPAPQGPTQAEIDAQINAIASDATVLNDKVKVTGPLKIKKPGVQAL